VFPGIQATFEPGRKRRRRRRYATVQVDDTFVLVAGENDALVEGAVAMPVNEAETPQKIARIPLSVK